MCFRSNLVSERPTWPGHFLNKRILVLVQLNGLQFQLTLTQMNMLTLVKSMLIVFCYLILSLWLLDRVDQQRGTTLQIPTVNIPRHRGHFHNPWPFPTLVQCCLQVAKGGKKVSFFFTCKYCVSVIIQHLVNTWILLFLKLFLRQWLTF